MKPDDLTVLLGDAQSDFSKVSCAVTGSRKTAAELDALLASAPWDKASGWIARQSRVIFRPHDQDDTTQGAVLEAELGTDTSSLQIRRLEGGWVVTLIEEGTGDDMLADEVHLVTTFAKVARYRRYWALPDDGAAEITACRLVGFTELKA